MPRVSRSERAEIAVWRARLERAKARRKKNKEIWDRNLRYYIGDQWHDIETEDHEVTINKVFAAVRAQLPSLIFSRPHYYVRERRRKLERGPDGQVVDVSRDAAMAKERWLNYRYREHRGHYQVRLATLAGFFSLAAVKVGYTPIIIDNPERGECLKNEDGEYVMTVDEKTGDVVPALTQGDYLRLSDGSIVYGPGGIPELEPARIPGRGQYFIEWVPAENFLFDPEGKNDFHSHRWVAEEWVRPLEEVRNDPLFNRKSLKNLTCTTAVGAEPGDSDPNNIEMATQIRNSTKGEADDYAAVQNDEARVRGYEIWDFVNNELVVLIDASMDGADHEFFLRREPIPDGIEHGPYVFAKFNEVPGRWEPYADVTPLTAIQDEYNRTRSQILTHKERADRKYLYLEDTFPNEEEFDKLKHGGDMSFAMVSNLAGVKALETAPLDASVAGSVPMIQADFDEVAGQGGEARGVASADTATQASILEGRSQVRESDRRDNVINEFVTEVGRKLLQVGQVYSSEEEWVSIGDPDEHEPFDFQEPVNPSQLSGEFDVSIELGSMLPRTTAIERQQWMQLLTLLSQNPTIMASQKMLQRTFDMFEVRDKEMQAELTQIGQSFLQAESAAPQGGSAPVMDGAPGQQGPDIPQVARQYAQRGAGAGVQ